MAYANTTRTGSVTLVDRFGALVATVKLALHRRRVYAQTVRELGALSERELGDLGIHSSMIKQIAAEAAYGA